MKKSTSKLISGMNSHFKEQIETLTKKHPNYTIADLKYELYNDTASMLDIQDAGIKGISWLSKNKLLKLSDTVKVIDVDTEYTAMNKLKLCESKTGMGQCSIFPNKLD